MSIPLRVLLIQNSQLDSAAMLEVLRRGGYDPVLACVGAAGPLANALAQPWEIVLCEWPLSGREGSAMMEMLRGRDVDLPVLAITSTDSVDGGAEAIAAGAEGTIPVQARLQLVAAVERALREAEIRRARRRAEEALRESGERLAPGFTPPRNGMGPCGRGGRPLGGN